MYVGWSWHLATPQRVSTAYPCLSCEDECRSWKGGLLASSCFPPPSFPQLISAGPGLVLFTRRNVFCSQLNNWIMNSAYAPTCSFCNHDAGLTKSLLVFSLLPTVARLNIRQTYIKKLFVVYLATLLSFFLSHWLVLWGPKEFGLIHTVMGLMLILGCCFVDCFPKGHWDSDDFSNIWLNIHVLFISCIIVVPL